jgi:hypothetical protein
METNESKAMTVQLSGEQAEELEAVAQVEGVPISEIVRAAIGEHIAAAERTGRSRPVCEPRSSATRRSSSDSPVEWEYLDLADYLLIAEAVLGVDAAALVRVADVGGNRRELQTVE